MRCRPLPVEHAHHMAVFVLGARAKLLRLRRCIWQRAMPRPKACASASHRQACRRPQQLYALPQPAAAEVRNPAGPLAHLRHVETRNGMLHRVRSAWQPPLGTHRRGAPRGGLPVRMCCRVDPHGCAIYARQCMRACVGVVGKVCRLPGVRPAGRFVVWRGTARLLLVVLCVR